MHAEVWATDTIPADLPPMVEFKAKADAVIKERWSVEVEHIRAKNTFEDIFYRKTTKSRKTERNGKIYGWSMLGMPWCQSSLKMPPLRKAKRGKEDIISYIGIAADEPKRFKILDPNNKSPLVEAGWTEAICRERCEKPKEW